MENVDKKILLFLFLKSVQNKAIFTPKLWSVNPGLTKDFDPKIWPKANKILSLNTCSVFLEASLSKKFQICPTFFRKVQLNLE